MGPNPKAPRGGCQSRPWHGHPLPVPAHYEGEEKLGGQVLEAPASLAFGETTMNGRAGCALQKDTLPHEKVHLKSVQQASKGLRQPRGCFFGDC